MCTQTYRESDKLHGSNCRLIGVEEFAVSNLCAVNCFVSVQRLTFT